MKRTAEKALLRRHASLFRAAVAVLVTWSMAAGAAFATSVSFIVLKRDGKPLVGAVVMAEPESGRVPAPLPQKALVDQVELSFVPDVTVIPVGSSVSFPNSDQVSHQVYSFSPARRFQLPLYRGEPHAPVVFDQPGIVTLGCNIHDNMAAFIVVTNAPFFGRTDDQGAWTIPSLPDGLYRIKLWHPLLRDPTTMLERPVRIESGHNDISVKIEDVTRPAPLKGRPHSWEY
jgi:plastocyanin